MVLSPRSIRFTSPANAFRFFNDENEHKQTNQNCRRGGPAERRGVVWRQLRGARGSRLSTRAVRGVLRLLLLSGVPGVLLPGQRRLLLVFQWTLGFWSPAALDDCPQCQPAGRRAAGHLAPVHAP